MTEWKVGDLFVINQANPSGGAEFGTKGDVGRVNRVNFNRRNYFHRQNPNLPEFVDELYFDFVSLNPNEPDMMGTREYYLGLSEEKRQPTIYIASYAVSSLIKEYDLDQQLDSEEDLL